MCNNVTESSSLKLQQPTQNLTYEIPQSTVLFPRNTNHSMSAQLNHKQVTEGS